MRIRFLFLFFCSVSFTSLALSPLSQLNNEKRLFEEIAGEDFSKTIQVLKSKAHSQNPDNPGLAFLKTLSVQYPPQKKAAPNDSSIVFDSRYGMGLVAGILEFKNVDVLGGALILSEEPCLDRKQHISFFDFWHEFPVLKKNEESDFLNLLKTLKISYHQEENIFYLPPEDLKKWTTYLNALEKLLELTLEYREQDVWEDEKNIQPILNLFDSDLPEKQKKSILFSTLIQYLRYQLLPRKLSPNKEILYSENFFTKTKRNNLTYTQIATILQKLLSQNTARQKISDKFFKIQDLPLHSLIEYSTLFSDWIHSNQSFLNYLCFNEVVIFNYYLEKFLSQVFLNNSMGAFKSLTQNFFQKAYSNTLFLILKANLEKLHSEDLNSVLSNNISALLTALHNNALWVLIFVEQVTVHARNFDSNAYLSILSHMKEDVDFLEKCRQSLFEKFQSNLDTIFLIDSKDKGERLSLRQMLERLKFLIQHSSMILELYYFGFEKNSNLFLELPASDFFAIRHLGPNNVFVKENNLKDYRNSLLYYMSTFNKASDPKFLPAFLGLPGSHELFLCPFFWNYDWPKDKAEKQRSDIKTTFLPSIQEQISSLEKIYKEELTTLSSYAALELAYIHLFLALRNPDQEVQQKKQAKEWFYKAFSKIEGVVLHHNMAKSLNSLNKEGDGDKEGEYALSSESQPLFSEDLQETNRLINFLFSLLFEFRGHQRGPTTPIHYNQGICTFNHEHQLLNVLIEEEIRKKSPNFRLILCMFKFKLGLALPNQPFPKELSKELLQCISWKLPEPILLELFEALEAEKNPRFLIYADILKSYFEEHSESTASYPKLTQKLHKFFEERASYSMHWLAILARYYYDIENPKKGLELILEIDKNNFVNPEAQKLHPFAPFVWPEETWDYQNFKLLRPYVELYEKINEHTHEYIVADISNWEPALNFFPNCFELVEKNPLQLQIQKQESFPVKDAIFEVLAQEDYFSSLILHYLLEKIEKISLDNLQQRKLISGSDPSLSKSLEEVRLLDQILDEWLTTLPWNKPFDLNNPGVDPVRQNLTQRIQETKKNLHLLEKIQEYSKDVKNKQFFAALDSLEKIRDSSCFARLYSATQNVLNQWELEIKAGIKKAKDTQDKLKKLLEKMHLNQIEGTTYSSLQQDLQELSLWIQKYPDLLKVNPFPQETTAPALFQFAESQLSLVPNGDSYQIFQTLEQLNVNFEKQYQETLAFLKDCIKSSSESSQKIQILFEKIESLKRLETSRFHNFFDAAFDALQKAADFESMGALTKNLNNTHDDHGVLSESQYFKLVQASFISGHFLKWFCHLDANSKSNPNLKEKIFPFRKLHFVSCLARIIHELKVQRLMLRVSLFTENTRREKLGKSKPAILKSYKSPPTLSTENQTFAILSLNQLSDYPDSSPKKRFDYFKKNLRPGDHFRFFSSEEAFQDFKTKKDPLKEVPIFEVIHLQREENEEAEGKLTLSWINQNSFPGQTFASILNSIPKTGVIHIEITSNLKDQHSLLQQILQNLTEQLPEQIAHFKQAAGARDNKKTSGKQSPVSPFQLKINGQHQPLMEALLGLSPDDKKSQIKSAPREPLSLKEQSLNDAQQGVLQDVLNSRNDNANPLNKITMIEAPGGTGKTLTIAIVNAALLKENPGEQIAVTAPTHAAVDAVLIVHKEKNILFLIRLASTDTSQKINPQNISSWNERKDLVAGDLKSSPHSRKSIFFYTLSGFNGDPILRQLIHSLSEKDQEKLRKYLERSVIHIDEASMATLPEILLLLAKRARSDTSLTFWGDTLQLPPYGLNTERKNEIREDLGAEFLTNFEGVDLEKTLFNPKSPWLGDILSIPILRNHGQYGVQSHSFVENYRSTDLIVELLNEMGYSEHGKPMVSVRPPLSFSPQEQVLFFDSSYIKGNLLKPYHEEKLKPEEKGAHVNRIEIFDLLKQMGKDFSDIQDLEGRQITFISPYKSQIKVWEASLKAAAILGELYRLKRGEPAAPFDIQYMQNALGEIEKLVQRFNSSQSPILLQRLMTVNTQSLNNDEILKLISELETKLPKFIPRNMNSITLSRILDSKSMNLKDSEASTIHKVQGQQNRVVYISWVRSNSHGNLGFLGAGWGFNMQITAVGRAQDFVRVAASKTTWEKATVYNPEQSPYINQNRIQSAKTMLKYIDYTKKLNPPRNSTLPFKLPNSNIEKAA